MKKTSLSNIIRFLVRIILVFCVLQPLVVIAQTSTTINTALASTAPTTSQTVDFLGSRVVRPARGCPQPFLLTAKPNLQGSSGATRGPLQVSDANIRDGTLVIRIISLQPDIAFRPEALLEFKFAQDSSLGVQDPNSLRFLLDELSTVSLGDTDAEPVASNQPICTSEYVPIYFPNYLNGLNAEYHDQVTTAEPPAAYENRSVLTCSFQKVSGYVLRSEEEVFIYTGGNPTNDSSCAISVYIGSLLVTAETRNDVANTLNVLGTMAFMLATAATPIVGVAAISDLQLYAVVMQSQCSSPYHRAWTSVAKYFVAPFWSSGPEGIIGYNILICAIFGFMHFSVTYLIHKLVCLEPRTLIFRMSQTYFPSLTFHCINLSMIGIYYGAFYLFQDTEATTLKALAALGILIVITLPIVHAILESARFMRLTFHKCNWGLLESETINVTREKDLGFAIRMRLAILPRGVFGPPKQLKRFSGVVGPYTSRRFIIFDRFFRFVAVLFLVALPAVLDCTVIFALFAVSCFLYTFVIFAIGAHRSHVSNALCALTMIFLAAMGALMGASVSAPSNMIEQAKVAVTVLVLLAGTAHAAFAVVLHYTESNRLEQMKEERRRIDAENAAIAARDGTAAPIIRPRIIARNNDRDDLTESGTMSVASYYFDDDDDDSSTIGKSEDAQSKFSLQPPSLNRGAGGGGGQIISNNTNITVMPIRGGGVSGVAQNNNNVITSSPVKTTSAANDDNTTPNNKRFENGGKGGRGDRDREDKGSRKHRHHHRGDDYYRDGNGPEEEEESQELTEEQIRRAKRREEKRAKKLQEKENVIASREAAQFAKEFPLFAPPSNHSPPNAHASYMQSNTSHGTSMSNNVSQSATIARTNTNNAFHVPTTSAPFHPKAGSSGAHHATSSNNTSSTLHPNGPNSPHPQHLANNGTNYYLPPGSLSSPLGGAQYYQQQPHQQWPTEAPRHISHQQHHSNNNNNYQSNQNFLASQSPFTAADSPAKGSAESAGPQNNYTTAQFSMNHPDQRSPHHGLAARQYIDDGGPHSGHIRRAGDPSAPSPPFSFDDQTTSFGSPSSAHEVIQHRTHDTLHHHQHAMADTRLPSYYTQDSSDNNGRNLDHRGHHHHQLYNSSHQHQGMPQRGGSGNFTGGSHDFPHGGPQYASVQGKPHYASGDGDGRYGHNNNSNNNIAHVVSPLNHTNQRGFDLSEGSPSAGSPILIPNTSRSDGPNQRIAIAKEERVAVGQGNVAQRHVNNDVSSPVDAYANTNSFQPPARMNSFEAALRAPSHRGVTLPAPPPPPRVPTGPVETPSYVAGNHNNNEDDDDDDDCELDAFNTLHAIDMAQGEEDMMED